jgi:hypothetical protein
MIEVDANYRRFIGPRWISRYPNEYVKLHHYAPPFAFLGRAAEPVVAF